MRDVEIKRVYDAPAAADGYRVLVDRLWPRGITKERAHLCPCHLDGLGAAPEAGVCDRDRALRALRRGGEIIAAIENAELIEELPQ